MASQIILLFAISCAYAFNPPEYMKKMIGTENLQIGFGEDCYLYWAGKSGDWKPGEFRCGTKRGDPMQVVQTGEDEYKIKTSYGRVMYWLGQSGDVKPMQFRTGPGDTFWIRKQDDGSFAIGFNNCPLYWKGKSGNTKPAEFRCGKPIKDTFWIKGTNCTAKIIEPIADDNNQATYDGQEIIGVSTSGTCSKTNYQTLILGRTDEVTEEIAIEMAKTDEVNFEVGGSISVTGEVGLFGTGVETTATVHASFGGATSVTSSTTKSTGMTTSNSAGSETHYPTPGAAIVFGVTKRYVFDKSNVPAKVTAECKNGYQYTADTTIKLRSKVFGSTFFSTDAVRFKDGQCKEEYLRCMEAKSYRNYNSIMNAKQAFMDCFPEGSIEKKKKKKAKASEE